MVERSVCHPSQRYGELQLVPGNFSDLDQCINFCWNMLVAGLEHYGLGDRAAAVEMALREALCNAFRHGNQGNPETPILFRWRFAPGELTCAVRDRGQGFDVHHPPDPTTGENLRKEAGRGLFMIRALACQVSWQRDGRQITMIFTAKND